jgi:hypothetical protein
MQTDWTLLVRCWARAAAIVRTTHRQTAASGGCLQEQEHRSYMWCQNHSLSVVCILIVQLHDLETLSGRMRFHPGVGLNRVAAMLQHGLS